MTKMSAAEQESLIALLTRIYTDLYDIETQYQLLAGGGDFRVRIEYFHDAIRAFSAGDASRLTVEHLSYDLKCLRFLTGMPLSSFRQDNADLSPRSDVVAMDPAGMTVKRGRPDRHVKERISELYQSYAVLFAALLKANADHDYHERTDNLNQDVEDLHKLASSLDQLANDPSQLPKVMAAIQHLDDGDLRQQLLNFIQQNKHSKKDNLRKLMDFLKSHAGSKDVAIAGVEEAHMNYVMSQLGIYENSKDLLKKMAAQGMNLVGKFVEKAMAETRKEMGR